MDINKTNILTNKIKLVIWDLDETFWKGTLSEEGVHIIEENIKIVKELVNRGIMNSIVSKNNYEEVKEVLISLNIWDYFIFPCIEWQPKGEMIKWVLQKAQLRDENTLFIDDNNLNLAEAKYYNPKINIAAPEFISEILSHESFKGKDDKQHTRLKQYKILEEKEENKKFFSSDTEFLMNSNIKVEIKNDTESCFDRIYELIDRTNQLNFTKKRISKEELAVCLKNPELQNAYINVKDKYGDYGISGFYSFNKISNQLEHFIFSCRILNLGVEQYVYALLNFPRITIIPDVAAQLNDKEKPEWINSNILSPADSLSKRQNKQYNLLIKGGCDLEQVFHYLKQENIHLKTEFPFTFKNHHQLRSDCTLCIKNAVELDEKTQERLTKEVPFIGRYLFRTEVFSNNYDVLVFSLVNNYTTVIYREKNTGIKIPSVYKIFDESTGDLHNYFHIREIKYDGHLLSVFKEHFDYLGEIPSQEFKDNLKLLRQKVSKPIIFINATEVPFSDIENTPEYARINVSTERIIEMNRAVDEFIAENKNCYLIDMRELVQKSSDMKISAFQFKREIYIKIANRLLKILEEISESDFKVNKTKFIGNVITKFLKDAKDKLEFILSIE